MTTTITRDQGGWTATCDRCPWLHWARDLAEVQRRRRWHVCEEVASTHGQNLSESPTGSPSAARAGGFRDKLARAAIPILQRVKTVRIGGDLMPLARDIVDRMLPLSVSMADALTGELDELRLYVGVIDRRRDELAAERDALRARLDAVLALAALIDRHTERESDPVDFRDADTGMWDEVAARIRRAAEGVE